MESLLQDVRYGVRMLAKTRGLTLIAILSLAVGIGGNAAIFSLVNSILFRPRAVEQPHQLVALYGGDRGQPYQSVSYPSYLELRERNEVLSGLAAYSVGWQFKAGGANDVEQVWGEVVSGNYFEVLGVRLHLGRGFLPEEDSVPGRNPVVVIGFELWQRKLAGDPGAVGKTFTINGQPVTVVGVASQRYSGMMGGWAAEVWVPAMTLPLLDPSRGEGRLGSRGSKWVAMIGRLKPGTTFATARARFDLLTKELQSAYPDEWIDRRDDGTTRESFLTLLPESQTRVHPAMRAPAYALAALLFVIVDLVLVIACINLASMLFARALARRNEIAVRLALGAGRPRIVRQLLTESVLLSLCGAAIGATLAIWGLKALVASMPALPEGIRVAVDIHVDWSVLLYTIGFATLTGMLFGLAPALHASRSALSSVLKEDGAVTPRVRRSRVRQSLVVAQVAFSLLLLIGAGLVLRSLENVRPTRLGFASENMLVAPVALDDRRLDRARVQRFYEDLSDKVAALPGVKAVSLVEGMPGGFMSRSRRSTEIEGYVARAGESLELDAAIVGPLYFTNMKVPLLSGRDFTRQDRAGAPCVAIVNEVFAKRYLGGLASAPGKRLARFEGSREQKTMCEVVGVVRDDQWQSINAQVRPFYALPLLQSDERRMTLLVETAVDPTALTSSLRASIRVLDPNMPVTDVQTLAEYFRVAAYPFRLLGGVMAASGALALLLSIIGIYGIVAHSVAQRQREVGIRIALGALHSDILKLVLAQGMVLVSVGLMVGLVLGLALTRVLTSMPLDLPLLFGVSATDVATFGGVTLLLGTVALAACIIPARRAAKVDPMSILRDA